MPTPKSFQAPKELLQAQKLANSLDTAVRVPIIGVSVGLDFFLGLIPVMGDVLMMLLSLRIIQLGKRLGMPKPLLGKMLRNASIDMVLGFIPFVGDIADIFYKANQANVRLMERWWIGENKSAVDQYTQQQLDAWEARHDSENTP